MAKYIVERRSGRPGDPYRTILDTDDEIKARRKFQWCADRLRCGGVRLIVDGKEQAITSGPNLRSKW